MNKAALKALKASIKHWEEMRDCEPSWHNYKLTPIGKNCPLCQLFLDNSTDGECSRCPVFLRTKESLCFGSPYHYAKDVFSDVADWKGKKEKINLWKIAAQKEIDFLKSLLPQK